MVLSIVRSIMHWYQSRNDDYVSPIVRGMKRSDAGERARFLNNDEIRVLWQCADDCGQFGAMVKTLLLTAQRLGKVANMKWDDEIGRASCRERVWRVDG